MVKIIIHHTLFFRVRKAGSVLHMYQSRLDSNWSYCEHFQSYLWLTAPLSDGARYYLKTWSWHWKRLQFFITSAYWFYGILEFNKHNILDHIHSPTALPRVPFLFLVPSTSTFIICFGFLTSGRTQDAFLSLAFFNQCGDLQIHPFSS